MSQVAWKELWLADFSRRRRRIELKGLMVLPAEVEELIASLKRRIAALEAEVADLRR